MSVSKLNPSARIFKKALLEQYPRFSRNLSVEKNGEFETFIWSPPGSDAGALVCQSFRGDVWVRFAPGQTACCCESVPDLLKTVRDLLAGKVIIAVVTQGTEWVETLLMPVGQKPALKRGQTVATYSWLPARNRRRKALSAKAAANRGSPTGD
jgi:hypothetical protein